MDDEQLFQFWQINRDLQIERDADGDVIIMAPEGGTSGKGGSKLNTAFENWAERDGTGEVFGSSTGFILPNHALRSPDIACVRNDRLEAVSEHGRNSFRSARIFVLELRSPSDSLHNLQSKLEEYLQNGAQLGWLLDPVGKNVHVYRPDAAPEILQNPATVSGEPLLRGFILDLQKIWAAMERKKQ
jgi:Uma2 family endonuclease